MFTKYLINFFFLYLVTKKNSYKMNPFNTARSDSQKTKTFKKVSNESFKQTSVPPVITGRFTIWN